jgi:hypothetical protein
MQDFVLVFLEEGRCWVAVGVAPALSAAGCSEKLRGVAKSSIVTGFGFQTNLLEVAMSKRPLALIRACHVQMEDGE